MKKHLYKIFSCFFIFIFALSYSSILALEDIGVVEGRLANVEDPINSQDAANKKYVDDSIDMLPEPSTVLQTTGQSETAVMSQKAVTDSLDALDLSIIVNQQAAIDVVSTMIQTALTAQLNKIYPVGSIYTSVNSTNPNDSTSIGFGTWESWGQSRVPLGMGSNGTTNYTTVEAKNNSNTETHTLTTSQMPSHEGHVPNASYAWGEAGESTYVLDRNSGAVFQHATNRPYVVRAGNEMCIRSNSSGNGNAHNNIQPYITVYMWKRTT